MRNGILSKNINKTKHKNLKKHPKAPFQTKAWEKLHKNLLNNADLRFKAAIQSKLEQALQKY